MNRIGSAIVIVFKGVIGFLWTTVLVIGTLIKGVVYLTHCFLAGFRLPAKPTEAQKLEVLTRIKSYYWS